MAGLGQRGPSSRLPGHDSVAGGVPALGCRHPVVQLRPCLVTFSSRQLAHRLPLARWRHGSGHRPGCLGGSSYAAARRIARPAAYRGAQTWSRSEAHAPRLHGIGHGPWARRRCVAAGAGYPRLCLCACEAQLAGQMGAGSSPVHPLGHPWPWTWPYRPRQTRSDGTHEGETREVGRLVNRSLTGHPQSRHRI
jgi:hypothetical protein